MSTEKRSFKPHIGSVAITVLIFSLISGGLYLKSNYAITSVNPETKEKKESTAQGKLIIADGDKPKQPPKTKKRLSKAQLAAIRREARLKRQIHSLQRELARAKARNSQPTPTPYASPR